MEIAADWLAADAREACERGRACFELARERVGCRVSHASFAGRRLRLELAGSALADALTPAFIGIDPPPDHDDVDLTLRVWEGASTGVVWPAPDPGRASPLLVGRNHALGGRRSDGGARFMILWEPPLVYGFDLEERVAHFFSPRLADVMPQARSQPCLRLLHAWARAHRHDRAGDREDLAGDIVVHAAAIGRGDRGVLLVGPGGSGKSTLAVAAALSGWTCVGDDYVAVDADRPDGPRASALYAIAKLDHAHLERRLPAAAGLRLGEPREDGKALLQMGALLTRRPMELTAVVVPEVVRDGAPRAASTLAPTGPGRAMRALAPSSLLQLPGWGAQDFARMAALVRRLPTYTMQIGADLGAALELLAPLCEPTA